LNIFPLIVQLIALACLFIAAVGWFTAPPNKPFWGWLGLFLWLLSEMIASISLHAAGVAWHS
jgi:hypothetical protein